MFKIKSECLFCPKMIYVRAKAKVQQILKLPNE
nr:MAG TPA: hypothetical protein [Caudoviricetes sp.]